MISKHLGHFRSSPNQPNISLVDALLTACGHTPLRHIQQRYDAEQNCWCVRGEVESMDIRTSPQLRIDDNDARGYHWVVRFGTEYDDKPTDLIVEYFEGKDERQYVSIPVPHRQSEQKALIDFITRYMPEPTDD